MEVVPESRPVQIIAERENDPIEIDQGPRTVDAALRSTWGQLGNEGLSGYIKLTDTDGTPAALRRRGQDMGAYYDTQARLARREQARTTREAADRQETEQQLTVEEWNSLTPLQQAAAQMNADLAQAIQKDLEKRPHAASREQLGSYQARVDELFGGRGGTGYRGTEYAPNTIAFLDAREIKAADLAGKTLDDFLSGDVLLSIDEVKKLGDKGDVRASRKSLANRLATGQLVFQEKLASTLEKGTELLSSVSSGVTSVEATGSYGARSDLEIPLEKVQPETAAQFPKYLQALARSDIDLEAALETINLDLQQRGATEEEAQVIWDGLMKRTNQSAVGAGEWFPDAEVELRSPLEVAQALGVPSLKRQFVTRDQGR